MFRFLSRLIPIFLIALVAFPLSTFAASSGHTNLEKANRFVTKAIKDMNQGDLTSAKTDYAGFKKAWLKIEGTVKPASGQAYKDIESAMGQVEYAFLQNKSASILESLKDLKGVNQRFIDGKYKDGTSLDEASISMNDFIGMLEQTKEASDSKDQQTALNRIKNVQDAWLSVEGKVVSHSSKLYSQSEQDLVVIQAMIQNKDFTSASAHTQKMMNDLSPLAQVKGYSIWDAAMIPVREGLEALLVVGALLTFVKKTNEGKGKGWIWSGVSLGVGLSAVLAVIVKVVFNSGAFGTNNFLISGITGLFAAVMLLYMSYWLHSKSNVAEWNRFIKAKSQAALTSGSLISLGFLSFLAVFREGTETVLFVIGMSNQISLVKLLLGLLVGVAVLMMIAILIFVVGVKLPIRPFFMVSSLIIFYLCLKFTGLGIHSLQLAGMLPTTLASHLPSLSFIAFFPTWESSIPQLLLLVFALGVLLWNRRQKTKITD